MKHSQLIKKRDIFESGVFFYRDNSYGKRARDEELVIASPGADKNYRRNVCGLYFNRIKSESGVSELIKKRFYKSNCGTNCCWLPISKPRALNIFSDFNTNG
jgi:hypothetical protein